LDPFLAAAHYYVIWMREWVVTNATVPFVAVMAAMVAWFSQIALAIFNQCIYPEISPKVYSAYLQ